MSAGPIKIVYGKSGGRGGRGYIDTAGKNRRVQCPWLQLATGWGSGSEGVGKLRLWELSGPWTRSSSKSHRSYVGECPAVIFV
jgi:hypothetical protein